MQVRPDDILQNFRIVEKIGEGGMGVVWKAIDTILDREVAIKVLPAIVADDAERLARFEREAKLLGSLNHPNIATVHGLHSAPYRDTQQKIRFLVMELVEGEDLSQRLARGPLPLDESIEIARQIAEGLEAAHAAGVIHRDLKPANIKLSADGRVKVLDFGLARAFDSAATSGSGEVSPTMSPTLTSAGTLAGVILGTAAYMSPEQARGHHVDNRADVWAFGVVLYEMLSGRSAFKGDTVSDTLASVLKLDPDFGALPPAVPPRVRRLVMRCIRKDRKQRFHHIADARITLEEAIADVPDDEMAHETAGKEGSGRHRLPWIATVILVAIAAAVIAWNLRPAPEPLPHRKILLALDGVDPDLPSLGRSQISPDGKRILYQNGETVFVRELDDWQSREISAAAGASLLFWSNDGNSIGFIQDTKLSRVSADGGGSSVISDLPGYTVDAAWGADGTILLTATYDGAAGLYSVSERGGEPRKLLVAEEGSHFHDPCILPGREGILLNVHRGDTMILSVLADGKLTTLVELETTFMFQTAYSPSGHVLYNRGGTNEGIWALPFSLSKLQATGEPFLVAAGGGGASISRDGTLVYGRFSGNLSRRLVWVDRQGEILDSIGQPQLGLDYPTLSPDGSKVAVGAGEGTEKDLWIIDVKRGTQTRLTFDEGREADPAWTPDGERVVYRHQTQEGSPMLMITSADGSTEPEKLIEGFFFSLSPDGRYLVFSKETEETTDDLWVLDLDGGGDPVLLVGTDSDEDRARVSLDGDYVAYESDESGRNEIYLKRFPSGEGKWQASVAGGARPRWSPKGDELFWIADGGLWSVELQTRPELKLGVPRNLFAWRPPWMLRNLEFDVTDDAQRFLLVAPEAEPDSPNEVMLVENWFAELETSP